MTSSLVGSEMCIRDSAMANRSPGKMADIISPDDSSTCGTAAGRRSPTVSYTHLTLPTICSV
eukprot:9830399-Prorocentrum_lima.AAC.1